MANKRHKPEEIVSKLRQVDVQRGRGFEDRSKRRCSQLFRHISYAHQDFLVTVQLPQTGPPSSSCMNSVL